MRIGITGAGGFVGTTLTTQARAAGHEVIAFSRCARGDARKLDSQAEVPADLEGLDALVHLAGEPMLGIWTAAKRQRIRESRVGLTERLVAAMPKKSPSVFVAVSGTGFYGDRGDDHLTEDEPAGSGWLAELARDWEGAAAGAASEGRRVCHARLGVVFGKGGGALTPMALAFRCFVGGRLGSGRQWVPWVHREDAATALLRMAEDEALSGPINVVAPEDATNADLTAGLAKVLRRPALFPVPAWAIRLGAGGMSEMLLGSQRAQPTALEKADFAFAHPSLEGALRDALGVEEKV